MANWPLITFPPINLYNLPVTNMSIPFSKKELLRDNQQMKIELDNLFARNVELIIIMEKQQKLINEANKKIEAYNASISKFSS